MSKYAMFGKLTAHPGKREELAKMMLEADTLNDMEGCIYYILHEAEDEPDVLWITELWESQEAHAASLKNEKVRELIGRCRHLIAEAGGVKVRPIGGKGF
ncbi:MULTISPECIES: putative quinol monooxygenase [Paenibacillus]|uniref:Antibiotic biosynthesis monooxygenase n=2 Tax=Paenibacillus TaxID=44249 RepID=A0A081P0A1_9BACL|nr:MULTISPECIES: putative quinol monooxygenase [Paenibacillus]KEQ24124.1 antibiotic biosynthesis monooxygenase [Paenibacillus tyrfis]KZE78500.1 antibiotic biosynthesis monooxygenase [Paenibacillus elgii]PUA37480.1 antibiotic biosynthesis monooxygenase [Paenibacillus elgii]